MMRNSLCALVFGVTCALPLTSVAGPCGDGVYAIQPLLGLEAAWNKLPLKTGQAMSAASRKVTPQLLFGAKLDDFWSLEATLPLKTARHTVTPLDVVSHLPDGTRLVTTKPPYKTRHKSVALRLIGHYPLNEELDGLLGLGVVHHQLKSERLGVTSRANRLSPSALVGFEMKAQNNLALRVSGTYSWPKSARLHNARVKHHFGASIGLVGYLP